MYGLFLSSARKCRLRHIRRTEPPEQEKRESEAATGVEYGSPPRIGSTEIEERDQVPLVAHRIGGRPKIPAVPIEPWVVLGGILLEDAAKDVIERFGFAHGPTRLTQSWPHPTSVIATPRRPGERRALAIRLERGVAYINGHADVPDANSFAEVALLGMIDWV